MSESEEERARKFVERHFPVTARFLAAERGGGPAPVFGPGELQNVHDDQPEPRVTVRVAYQLSRFELLAAVSAGYAATNVDRSPDDMTVEQIRYDVEAFLAHTSALDLDALVEEVAGKVERGEDREQFEALRRAMDRAYPVAATRPARVRGEGTVTVQTLDRGPVEVREPFWCVLDEHPGGGFREDIQHEGEEQLLFAETACHGQVVLARASLFQRPFSSSGSTAPMVTVEFDERGHEYDAASLAGFADSFVSWAVGPLHELITRLQLLEGGE